MRREIDVLPTSRRALRLELMRAGSTLPVAQMRHGQMHVRAHRQLTNLVLRLFLSGPQSSQAVVFSAVDPGSGCTFLCTRMAQIIADQLKEPVCMVDANFRSPGLNRHFKIEERFSVPRYEDWMFMPVGSNYQEARTSNFWLCTYKPETPDCPPLASLDRFRTLIEDLRKDFTYVLIDAPPLNEHSEAALFAQVADGLVLVLQANGTRRESAQKAKELLDASGIPVLGAVLNNRTYPIPESIYRRL